MRLYRITFFAGLGTGYVLGTRAGRERYEQIMKLYRSAAEHPAVQQAAGTLQAQATGLLSSAAGGLHDRVPKLAQSAMHKAGDHIPGVKHKNGHRGEADGNSDSGDGHLASSHRHNGRGSKS
jgi:hypothetical protein